MISIFGTQLGFLFPHLLWALPAAAGALVYAYLRRGRGKKVPVASLLLLRMLKRRAHARKNFIPPPRFFFELLLVLILSIAAAGLFSQGAGRKVALLIDNSLSMAAEVGSHAVRTSLFTQAKSEASRYLDGVSSGTTVKIYTTSPQLKLQTEIPVSASAANSIIAKLSVSATQDNLDSAAAQILNSPDLDSLVIVSDKKISTNRSDKTAQRPNLLGLSVRNYSAKAELQNIAINSISRRSSSSDKTDTIEVGVTSFALSPVSVKVLLEQLKAPSLPFDYWTVEEQKLSIAAESAAAARFTISLKGGSSSYRVRVLPEQSAEMFDANPMDNSAWLSTSDADAKILVVSPLTPAALGLNAVELAAFSHVTPQALDTEKVKAFSQPNSAIIFHRATPAELPAANSFFVAPPQNNQLFEVGREIPESEITRWLSSHPALSYLNLPVLKLSTFTPLTPPIWGRELISTTFGAASFAGEHEGHRYLATGFEIFPFEGKKSPVLSIFLFNALKWLSTASAESGYKLSGSMLHTAVPESQLTFEDGTLVLESGEARQITASGKLFILERPGLYELKENAAPQILAVNSLFPEESDTLSVRTVSLTLSEQRSQDLSGSSSFAPLLALIVLVLLALDIILSTRFFGFRQVNSIRGP